MTGRLLIDAGLIVALLDRRDAHHAWAVEQFKAHPPPFVTCEAVLTEASHILMRNGFDADLVFELVEAGAVVVDFDLGREHRAVRALMRRYRSVPMDLADACLVRMAELDAQAAVFTVDRDFYVYRKNEREAVPSITPHVGP